MTGLPSSLRSRKSGIASRISTILGSAIRFLESSRTRTLGQFFRCSRSSYVSKWLLLSWRVSSFGRVSSPSTFSMKHSERLRHLEASSLGESTPGRGHGLERFGVGWVGRGPHEMSFSVSSPSIFLKQFCWK